MGLYKGRKKIKFKDFLMLGRDMVLHGDEWKQLSPSAKTLYLHIKAKHNGTNNGNIVVHYSELEAVRGLSSPSTASKAFTELEKKGWITRTHYGGLYRRPNKYSLTGRYDNFITDRSYASPEKYKETTYSVVQSDPPIGHDAFGLKICPLTSQSPKPVRTSDSEAIDPKKCS